MEIYGKCTISQRIRMEFDEQVWKSIENVYIELIYMKVDLKSIEIYKKYWIAHRILMKVDEQIWKSIECILFSIEFT